MDELFAHQVPIPVDRIVSVCLPVNIDRCFDYLLPEGEKAHPGHYVSVIFGNRPLTGIIWGRGEGAVATQKLKLVQQVHHDIPAMPEAFRQFIAKAAAYNCIYLGHMLRLALPMGASLLSARSEDWLIWRGNNTGKPLTVKRQTLQWLLEKEPYPLGDIKEKGFSTAFIRGMIEAGLVQRFSRDVHYNPPMLHPQPIALTEEQQEAADQMQAALNTGYQPFLLDGATGAGKTEVFFEVAEAVMRQNRQVVILVPEIALSLPLLERAKKRFGIEPILWHSSQTPAKRREALRQIIHGSGRLIIGARSALFLPYPQLGLIIVDEEHDTSFKQEEGVIYHARDMAVLRARQENCPIILTSATPSLETILNVQKGKYHALELHRRQEQSRLPEVRLVDMKQEPLASGEWISPTLQHRMAIALAEGRQVLLFINRRGYAPLVLCRGCGHRFECPSCTAWLVYHAAGRRLQCHHCGLNMPLPDQCPECGAKQEKLAVIGPGVERIEEEVKRRFPGVATTLLSSELSHTPEEMRLRLSQAASGEAQVIIGTQILAKGHHFPKLRLVGVMDADAGLSFGGDIRAAEKTYQLLHQLAGRAGREMERGEVLIQTYRPDHPLMQMLTRWDRKGFIDMELQQRLLTQMPPYGRLAALIIEGKPESAVETTVKALTKMMPQMQGIQCFGPAPALLYKLRNLYRYRFLVMAAGNVRLQPFMNQWRQAIRPPATVHVKIDIDPVSFF